MEHRNILQRSVTRWYINPLHQELEQLAPAQRKSVERQALIGWGQTILLIVVVAQSIFAGFLRILPPEIRSAVGFLHRIEWGVYLGIMLILAQVITSWRAQVVLTNRFYLLAWRFSRPRLVSGSAAQRLSLSYLLLVIVMIAALVWVRIHGFIFQPTP